MNKEINLVWSSKYGRNSGLFSYVSSTSFMVMSRDAIEFPFCFCTLHTPLFQALVVVGVAPCKLTTLTFGRVALGRQ